ncbi:MAG: hypothetical protein ABI572_08940 [Actinomycetota bacterium]
MRRFGVFAAIAVALATVVAGCGGDGLATSERSSPGSTASVSTGRSPGSPTGAPTASETPRVELPPGTPHVVVEDLAPADLDLTSLIPRGTDVERSWTTRTPVSVVIAYVKPGADPFRADRGTLVWRHFDAAPAWRAVAWFPVDAEVGVLGVDGLVADVTGDGMQDLLLSASTGGSGACARWAVIDVSTAESVFGRDLCDGRIDPSVDPVGLVVDQAVYRTGDPHCCPSAFETTVLTYDGDRSWSVASNDVRNAA